MTQIVLDEAQAAVVANANEPVEVRGPNGVLLGHIEPELTSSEIAELKHRITSPGRWYTTDQVLEHLRSLEPR